MKISCELNDDDDDDGGGGGGMCFSSCWPKDLKRPAGRRNIFPVCIHLSPPAQNVAFQ